MKSAPQDPMGYYVRSCAQIMLKKKSAARGDFKTAYRMENTESSYFAQYTAVPSTPAGFDATASLWEKADRACVAHPDDSGALLRRAEAYLRLGVYDAAAQDYRTVLEDDDENADAQKGMVLVFIRAGDYAKAIESLDSAAPDKTNRQPFMELLRGYAYYKNDQTDEAIKTFGESLQTSGKNACAYY